MTPKSLRELYQEQLQVNTRMIQENTEQGKEIARLKKEAASMLAEHKLMLTERDELKQENERLEAQLFTASCRDINFQEDDGTVRKLVWEDGDPDCGMPAGYAPDDSFSTYHEQSLTKIQQLEAQVEAWKEACCQFVDAYDEANLNLDVQEIFDPAIESYKAAMSLTPADALKRAEGDRAVLEAVESGKWVKAPCPHSESWCDCDEVLARAAETRREAINAKK